MLNKTIIFLLFIVLTAYAGTFKAKVTKIVDGDTVYVKGDKDYKIRLLNIDAQETNYQGQSQGEYAEKAKNFLKEFLPIGSDVTVEYDKQMYDVYKRLLGHILYKKQNINLILLEQGLAVTYIIYPNILHQKECQKATQQAIENNAGMFADPNLELPFEFRLRIGNRDPDKWVCDLATKQCFDPDQYKSVEIPNRVFFLTKKDTAEWQDSIAATASVNEER